MVTYTTTYNLKKPTVGQDDDQWGGYANDTYDLIDDLLDGTTPVTGIDINSGTLDNVVIGGSTANSGTFTVLSATTSLGVTGNITVSGTVDGRDVATDGTKLDGIESGATADQTKADIDALGIAASTAATLATARNIALTGDVSGSASFNGSANISITAAVADDSHNHVISNVDGLQTALDGKFATSGGTISGNVTIDNGTSTVINVVSDDNGTSGIRLYGASQGTGYVEVGQSTTYGGGLYYNGDGSPAFASGEASDTIGFYRLENGTRTEVFSYPYNSNVVTFNSTPTVSGSSVWHAGNDGSGSGLDADTLDGVQGSSYLRSDAADTFTTLSGTQLNIGSQVQLAESSDRADLLQITSTTSSWGGLQIRNSSNEGRWSFMTDGEVAGIYNDEDNQWHIYMTETGGVDLRHAATSRLNTTSSGANVTGTLTTDGLTVDGTTTLNGTLTLGANVINDVEDIYLRDRIYHDADTNTYIQFHAADQWRVVTGGAERLEVNNTRTQIDTLLSSAAVAEDYDALSGTTPTADPDAGGAFSLTMTGNTTFTFGAPALGSGVSTGFIIELTGNGGTVTWPTSVDWAGGTAPDAPASGETDIYVFWTRDGGTTWYGVQSIDAAA